MSDFFLIAEIIDFYDYEGAVIIKSFSDFPERFLKLKKVYVDFFGKKKELLIEKSKQIDDKIVLKFERFNTTEDVRFLLNNKLYVDSENLYELPEDSFYIHDLIDSEVYFGKEFFGKLIDILNVQNQDVYVIKTKDEREVLIPAVKKFFNEVLTNEKKIILSEEAEIFRYEN
ncbi:MAG: 16S rRNA processing protein RimM [Ignavibacteriales bacterium]|nr:16S rRNA processing protein RimM [Ignavibacteriales bacterium]